MTRNTTCERTILYSNSTVKDEAQSKTLYFAAIASPSSMTKESKSNNRHYRAASILDTVLANVTVDGA